MTERLSTRLRAWLHRADELLPAADREVLLSMRQILRILVDFGLSKNKPRDLGHDLGARDPELVGLMVDLVRLMATHYFRVQVDGAHHVPRQGPVLLVGNHSGGLMPLDAFFVGLAVWDEHGPERVIHSLGHDVLFHDPTFSRTFQRLGVLRAGHASAERAFAAGHGVLVYPGGDVDAYRPFTQRARVVLGGRTGFIRLALRCGVPVVPVVSAGTHEQMLVLTRGDTLGRVLGMHRLARTQVLPIIAALPWGVVPGFVPYFPLPAQTSLSFGPAISFSLPSSAAEDQDAVAECYRQVEASMQTMLSRLHEGRRFLLGRTPAASPPPSG